MLKNFLLLSSQFNIMEFLKQPVFSLFGFEALVWHVAVAAAAVLLLIVIIACAASSKRKKRKKAMQLSQANAQATATEAITEQPVQTKQQEQAVGVEADDSLQSQTEQVEQHMEDEMPIKEEPAQTAPSTKEKTKSTAKSAVSASKADEVKKNKTAPAEKQQPASKTAAKSADKPASKNDDEKSEEKPAKSTAKTSKSASNADVKLVDKNEVKAAKSAKTAAKPVEKTAETTPVKTPAKDESDAAVNAEQKPRTTGRYYHISLRDDGKWQVKLTKGDKAIKLFDKQSEAIAYAQDLSRRNHAHIVIHRVDGKIRKKRY